ncbi:hypothetical protein [Bdellovibrio sp. HCB337]|uniref:hypothetical protein n=1 Tax=Bdellovibrio sp. HCB337 TaxID=3394358 RepID=UPI0039A59718
MFSKRSLKQTMSWMLTTQFLWVGACSYFLDEKRQEPQTIEMSNAKFACLQSLPVEITKFVRGEVSDGDIQSGFKCAQDALTYFKNKTKGTYPDAYTMEDLRNFFGKYFLKKNNVTPAFAAELFKLKKVLLGGSEKSITKAEIQKLVELLEVIKVQAVATAPHMTTLMGQKKGASWAEVNQATQQLQGSLLLLLKNVDIVRSDYSFVDLKKFMDGLDNFINATEPFYLTEKLGSNIPLLEAIKNVLVGEDVRLDNLNDWQTSLKTGVGLYRTALRYRYFLQGQDIDTPAEVDVLIMMANEVFDLFEESLPMQHQGVISFAAIDNLLKQLELKKLLPLGLTARGLEETYKKVVLRMLDPQRRGDARGLLSLERVHLQVLKHEVKIYQIQQSFTNSLSYDASMSVSVSDIAAAAKKFSLSEYIEKNLKVDSLEQDSLKIAWEDSLELLLKDRPVFFDSLGRLIIVGSPLKQRQTWASLTKSNVMRALTRFLLLGYGAKKSTQLSREEMSQAGLELWYKDFNQLGTDLKAFDPRSDNAGARSFNEANFFTFNGNGDSIMNFHETFDFVSFLVAGGMTSAEKLRQDSLQCMVLATKDVFGYPMMRESCFKANMRKNFGVYFGNLPGMVRQVLAMNEGEWDQFYGNLLSAARISPASGGLVETADIRTAVMMLHYTESLMSVYDLDQSGKLNKEELRGAAPRFLEFMKQVAPVNANFMVRDFFLFLVYKGKKPTLWEYTYFQGEKAFGSLEDAGRDKILQVFKVLKDEAAAE